MTHAGAGAAPGIRVVSRIRDIDAAAWDCLAGDNPLLSHGWLRAMEDEWLEPVERRYLLMEDGERLVAASACYIETVEARTESVDDLLFGRLRDVLPGRLLSVRPALVCGYPWSLGPGCVTAPGLGEEARETAIAALVGAITEDARRLGCTAVFLSVTEDDTLLASRLRVSRYRAARHAPIYVQAVDWPDFEAYRGSLPSVSVRKNIRYEQNRNRKAGVVIEEIGNPSGDERQLYELVDGHFRRYGWPEFPFGPGWFGALKSNLGSDAAISVARRGEQVIGVAVSPRKQGTRQLFLVCTDHERTAGSFTYFNLAYYRELAECMRAGDRRHCVGPGQGPSRRRRGYVPMNTYIFCRPPGKAHGAILGLWMRILSAWLRRKARSH
jgi:predicted N-acyltransferase